MDWNNFYNGNNNPNMNRNYGYQPLMRYEVIQVNGRAGAESFRGVVRYPNGLTYNAGQSPFCGCGCNN